LGGWLYREEDSHKVIAPPAGADLPWLGGIGRGHEGEPEVVPRVGLGVLEASELSPVAERAVGLAGK